MVAGAIALIGSFLAAVLLVWYAAQLVKRARAQKADKLAAQSRAAIQDRDLEDGVVVKEVKEETDEDDSTDNESARDVIMNDAEIVESALTEENNNNRSTDDDGNTDVHKCASAACEICKAAKKYSVDFVHVGQSRLEDREFQTFLREVSLVRKEQSYIGDGYGYGYDDFDESYNQHAERGEPEVIRERSSSARRERKKRSRRSKQQQGSQRD
uniref:Uncharacterized protein n=1 Tax=Craspedostauros australis TaxID=1486917 RepID=A0A7R9WP47_9STRA|mmetsp:Transcript_12348/g.33964  ORF Transcript_12348/g.33964 Transcript_12348/m.33964 type:complete len:213 (+) Transcript_12348:266-904(+)|eukprot:CAMPEP_0198130948 /NCGR_PEP_ID=MMETSP1442-20131203/55050_1 /TAXON_ID= /ORGANISM="Craspedostauros australis, Strain CCMP3328" /LENGTH=212 /DNA_ID=CAMNT_0043791667 /DNA_START=245 /DNA_END=883 /DNA_ORIENTATION=-